jgi:hypothetical protein
MDSLKQKYLHLFSARKISPTVVEKIESRLSIKLPKDLKDILKYYDGYYDIANLSLYSFIIEENAWNVCDQTEYFRKVINLPKEYLVLKEGDESFIVLKTSYQENNSSPVIWMSSTDVYNLVEGKPLLDAPLFFHTFADFFQYLLDEEEKSRKEN